MHYRFWPGVRRSLDSLGGQTRPPDLTIAVDNGSYDGSAAQIQNFYPDFEVIEIEENHGPIVGWNAGLRAALARDADAILLVPHDCVLAPDLVAILAGRLEEDERLGAVGPLLAWLSQPERVYAAGGRILRRTWDEEMISSPDKVSEWAEREPFDVDWLNGSSTMFRAEAVRQAGFLNEDFFYYFEEPDYLMRLASLGWRVECVPRAVAWQEPGDISPYMYTRNKLGFIGRTAPKRVLLREIVRVLYYAARDAVRPREGVERREVLGRLQGLLDFLRGKWGPQAAAGT